MDRVETAKLVSLVEAMCPAQRFAEETPAIWAGLLADVTLVDALAAVRVLGTQKDFIAPKDIAAQVRLVRAERTVGIDEFRSAYPGDPDDARAEVEWWRSQIRRVADGEPVDEVFDMPALDSRQMPSLEGAFRKPPRQ